MITMQSKARTCGVENCIEPPGAKKRFCETHDHLNERTNRLMGEVEARQEEIDVVRRTGEDGWRFVKSDGHVTADVLACVRRGCKSVKDVARGTDLNIQVASMFLRHLVVVGAVQISNGGVYTAPVTPAPTTGSQ